jgi:hypothetical protein
MAAMASKQRAISDAYTFLSETYDAQDFPDVRTDGTDLQDFIRHANNFAKGVWDDRAKFEPELNKIKKLEREIRLYKGIDEKFAKRYGVDLKKHVETYASSYVTKFDEYAKYTGESQALMLNSQVKYIATIDDKAKEFLDGWDKVKKNLKTETDFAAALNVVDVLTGLGIGANGAFHLFTRDATSWTNARKFWDTGANGGDALDMVTMAFNTYNFYAYIDKNAINKTPSDVTNWVKDKVTEITGKDGNFQLLINRIKDHVEAAKKPPTDPNPWVPQ